MVDPRLLRPLKQFADEAPAFTVRSLRYLIAHAEEKGFGGCFVKVGGRIFIDTDGFASWLEQQRAQPQPHQRGIARKRGRSP